MMRYYAVPRDHRRIVKYRPVSFNGGRRLPVDVRLDENVFEITASVPGFRVEDINVEILDDALTLSGKLDALEAEGDYLLREMPRESFQRTLRFPVSVDPTGAEATVENGVLKVRVPKAEEAKPKVIKIKAN